MGQYVFRDLNGEIVVSYPDPSHPGRTETFRFWLQNRVDPQIAVALMRRSDGRFAYDYKVRNGPAAKTGIWAWSIVVPPSKELAISHPIWHGFNLYRSVGAPQALLKGAAQGVYAAWMDARAPIAPGTQLSGFEILSSLKPGLTTAYVTGDDPPIRAPTELTEDVVNQLIPLERAPVMSKVALTIGPRFAADASSRDILLSYQSDILHLIEIGVLKEKSRFIQELEQNLAQAVAAHRDSIATPNEASQDPIERDILTALKLAVQ